MSEVRPKDGAYFMFRFLGDVWLLLPSKDKRILSNFWASMVKTTGDLTNRAYELDLAVAIQDIPVHNNRMWVPYILDNTTALLPGPSEDFPYAYFLGDSSIVSIPYLRDRIDSPKHVLTQGADYVVQDNMIHFKNSPEGLFYNSAKPVLWAKDTFVNKNMPYRNFGAFIDLYQENSEQYLRVLQSVWYAYWNGPTLTNLLTSVYLFVNLPTAPFDARVTKQYEEGGRKYMELTSFDGQIELFALPIGIDYAVELGASVQKFERLSTGISIIDKQKDPEFMQNQVGRQGVQKYLTQDATRGYGDTDESRAMNLLKDHLWVAQINADAFESPQDIPAIRNFLSSLKPRYTDFILQMLRILEDYFGFGDKIDSKDVELDITVNTENTPVNIIDDTRYEDYVNNGNVSLNIDMDSLFFSEATVLEVRDSGGTLIDSFDASI